METYWNHNTAFHDELVADARLRGGRVLDIGCGDGLLLQRLTPFVRESVGIDPDEQAIARARERLINVPNASLVSGDFLQLPVPAEAERYDTITCVAALHHMPLKEALRQMRELLAPGGKLLVVGLAADKTLLDLAISGAFLLPIRLMDRLHGGMQDVGVRIAEPKESLREIRQAAREVLPGGDCAAEVLLQICVSVGEAEE
ncbi:class I SAM-dependent methyltransferase [Paenibacillus whitsoniae]|uniref:class I SAM-dependent methyltransferase n=1 Tax=Paenibacillus whitsoniae TaxID=2496558 RepID=UPI0019D30A44|nr:class I SAM-dependent methyltransferase [Paenibacillus whitsoniae]